MTAAPMHWLCTCGAGGTFTAAETTKTTDPASRHQGTASRPKCVGAVVVSTSARVVEAVGARWAA